MSQLKIKQVSGLQTALDTKVQTASNQGTGGQGLFKQKTSTDLEFYKLTSGSVAVASPSSDLIALNIDIAGITTEVTSLEATDRFAVMDDSASDATKWISKANLATELGGGGAVVFSDYTADSSASGDSIIFFDASDSNNPNVETKANFLAAYAPLASPTFTGTVTVPTPSGATDAATKAYVDAAAVGIDWKPSVRVATTGAGTLASSFENGDTVDGVVLATGDRILIKDQSAGAENGIYVVAASGAPTRATDADTSAEVTAGMAVFVAAGTTNADTGWVLTTNDTIVLDTTALVFTQFTGLGQVTAGSGLSKTGSTLDVNVDGTTLEIATDALQIKSTYAGQTSITTLGTVGTGTWNATTIGVSKGGNGLTSIADNSLLVANATDTYSALTLGDNTVVGRVTGDIVALSRAQQRENAQLREVFDAGTLTAASMTLGTLSQTPLDATKVKVSINGQLQRYTTDYTVSGTTVTATTALNVSFGGSAGDGNGFANDDIFQAVYTY